MDSIAIGKKLQKLRGNMTLTEAAYHYGVSASTVSLYENGKRIPSDRVKINIANFYNMTVGEIFFASNYDIERPCFRK
jgi:transcriptional regulator with XRE-family HTH domain